ncbi:hypothetical protein LTR53_012140 [Teratosphaeriaceae sp. CCFEE 6253]|nr:hypothetical protein LTR53_012140 [Teratosphaeriaceae sp. CCFEE 6253]
MGWDVSALEMIRQSRGLTRTSPAISSSLTPALRQRTAGVDDLLDLDCTHHLICTPTSQAVKLSRGVSGISLVNMAAIQHLPEELSSEAPSEEVVFAEEGDVMVVLRDGTRVRVASVVLSLVSPVFKKMLGPHFLEGQAARSADEPQEIVLPEDDPQATTLLLRIIHFQQPLHESVKPLLLANFATVADKYDCACDVA